MKNKSVFFIMLMAYSIYHFRFDIFGTDNKKFHILESCSISRDREEGKHQILLIEDVPQLMSTRRRFIEKLFWENISLDTLVRYRDYHISIYRETKYLTKEFVVGGTYPIPLDAIDETMSWRNHIDDRVAWITITVRTDSVSYYDLRIFDSGYGFDALIDVEDNEYSSKVYKNIEQLYHTKKKELGIRANP